MKVKEVKRETAASIHSLFGRSGLLALRAPFPILRCGVAGPGNRGLVGCQYGQGSREVGQGQGSGVSRQRRFPASARASTTGRLESGRSRSRTRPRATPARWPLQSPVAAGQSALDQARLDVVAFQLHAPHAESAAERSCAARNIPASAWRSTGRESAAWARNSTRWPPPRPSAP